MDMIEKVARALFVRAWGQPEDWSDEEDELAGVFRPDARAAIEAMREPTEEMVDDMQASLDCVPINRCVEQALQVWRGGIDSALRTDGGES